MGRIGGEDTKWIGGFLKFFQDRNQTIKNGQIFNNGTKMLFYLNDNPGEVEGIDMIIGDKFLKIEVFEFVNFVWVNRRKMKIRSKLIIDFNPGRKGVGNGAIEIEN